MASGEPAKIHSIVAANPDVAVFINAAAYNTSKPTGVNSAIRTKARVYRVGISWKMDCGAAAAAAAAAECEGE